MRLRFHALQSIRVTRVDFEFSCCLFHHASLGLTHAGLKKALMYATKYAGHWNTSHNSARLLKRDSSTQSSSHCDVAESRLSATKPQATATTRKSIISNAIAKAPRGTRGISGRYTAGTMRQIAQKNSMMLSPRQITGESAASDGIVCSAEWENFQTAPIAV